MREVILYGPMRAKFGKSFMLDVASPLEAFKALFAVVPGFKAWFKHQAMNGSAYHILVGKYNISQEELGMNFNNLEPIRIAPTISGSKNTKILGALLVVVGAVVFWFTGNPSVAMAGIGMMAAGVAMMLVPSLKAPSPNENATNKPSQVFDGPVNVTTPGNPVPILYGELEVGSVVVSAGIYTDDASTIMHSQIPGGHVGGGIEP